MIIMKTEIDSAKIIKYTYYIIFAAVACLITLLVGLYGNIPVFIQFCLFIVIVSVLFLFHQKKNILRSKKRKWINLVDENNISEIFDEAIDYCNQLINYYEHNRYYSRRYYLFFQVSTIALTGLTPIIVLIDKSDALKKSLSGPWLQYIPWLVIIFPGLAALFATVSTIFPFQQDWIIAKKTSEQLEAVREEFIVGASDLFQVDMSDKVKGIKQRKKALENFVIKVNEIHLKHLDNWSNIQDSEIEGLLKYQF
jgi:Protein of unknown function (DUF4231)